MQTQDEAWYLVKARRWNAAHRCVVKNVAPDAVADDLLLDVIGGGDQLNVAFGGRGSPVDGPVAVAAAAVEQRQTVPLVLRLPAHAAHRDEDGGQQSHRRQRR